MAIIDPDEVLGLGVDAIEAADVVADAGRRAQRVLDDIGSLMPGVVAPDLGRTFALIAADLADQGLIAKTRAEDLLANERPLSGLAQLVGAGYWTPAPRDPEHPLAHEFATAEVALPEAMLDRYLPAEMPAADGFAADGSAADVAPGGSAADVAPAVRWSALPRSAVDEPPVAAAWRGARAAHDLGGAGSALVTGEGTAVGAAAGGLAGVAAGMTGQARIESSGGFDTDGE